MAQNKEKIVICGHYGATNIGDEAILFAMLQNLKKVKPEVEITVLSYDPKNTKTLHNVHANYLLPLGFRSLFRGIFKGELWKTLKTIKNCDKFILGGGGLFTDEKIFAVFLWGLHAFCALKYKKLLYMFGQSVGPLDSRIGKWITKKAFTKAKIIYVRDTASKKVLNDLGIDNEIIIAPDLVFGIEISSENKDNIFKERLSKKIEQNDLEGYFLVNLRPWKKNMDILYKNIDQVLASIVQKYKLLPVLIPYQIVNQNDEEIMRKIIERKGQKYPFLIKKIEQNFSSLFHLTQHAKFTIGMRLHSIIISIICKTQFLALSYSPKIDNLLKDLGFENNIAKNFQKEELLNQINSLIDHGFRDLPDCRKDILDIFAKI